MQTEYTENRSVIVQLPKDIDDSSWARIKLKKLRLLNYGVHENVEVDFTHNQSIMNMVALIGLNGTGKTTFLNAIQLLFANFEGQRPERTKAMLQKQIRNYAHLSPKEMLEAKMEVVGTFEDNTGRTYEVKVNETGLVTPHPADIQEHILYYCFLARFDQELNQFQLKRQRWPLFQSIFSEVTGYPVVEDDTAFKLTEESRAQQLVQEYVGGFKVNKPRETITNRQCSAGEKKIAKCFSTILNKEVQPSIILIDNVTDHVEVGRHLPVVSNIERCFPNSQVIVTCHSVPVQRNLPNRERLIDLRLLHTSDTVKSEPFRLRFYDEVLDALEKANTIDDPIQKDELISQGQELVEEILGGILVNPIDKIAEFQKKSTWLALTQSENSVNKPKILNLK